MVHQLCGTKCRRQYGYCSFTWNIEVYWLKTYYRPTINHPLLCVLSIRICDSTSSLRRHMMRVHNNNNNNNNNNTQFVPSSVYVLAWWAWSLCSLFFRNNSSPMRRITNFVCRYNNMVHQTHPSGTLICGLNPPPQGGGNAFIFVCCFVIAKWPNGLIFKIIVKAGSWRPREVVRVPWHYQPGSTWSAAAPIWDLNVPLWNAW